MSTEETKEKAKDAGFVELHGRLYKTVAKRVEEFREDYKSDCSIETEILSSADYVLIKAVVKDEQGRVIATGHAEENRAYGINKLSAIENCETSAVGRALANFGYGGSEYCSADELAETLNQEEVRKVLEPVLKHQEYVRDNFDTVYTIKTGIALDDLSSASEAWFELDKETMTALWVAPSKGGIFTTKEREVMKSQEFRLANGANEDGE